MYQVYASMTDARTVTVEADDDFKFPFSRLRAAITPRTKMVVIANPNSPTGSTATTTEIVEIAAHAPHALILVDEAYFHFHGESVIAQMESIPNLMVARTFSKAFGLAGLEWACLLARPSTCAGCGAYFLPTA